MRHFTLNKFTTKSPHFCNVHIRSFHLPPSFVREYANVRPPFGFNGLGELVFFRTYSRRKLNGGLEQWYETVERVVNGTFSMQVSIHKSVYYSINFFDECLGTMD